MSGTAQVPNIFLGNCPVAISKFDQNFAYLDAYINAREITIGLLANRGPATTPNAWYAATDVFGGTLYVSTGSVWIQVASGVFAPTGSVNYLLAAGFGGGF